MKVLMINSVCGIRSTGRICTDLAVELEKQGHEVKIAYGRETVPKQFKHFAVRIGSDLDVKLHGLKARAFDAMGFGSKRATKKFIEWVEEYDPDVIHLHNIHGYYINIEVLFDYLKTCDKKIIWTLYDCWAFTGHSAYCDAVNCERWREGCYDCPQKSIYPKAFIDKSRINWQKKCELFSGLPKLTIIAPSTWMKGWIENSFLQEYKVEILYNGVDTTSFKSESSSFKEKYRISDKFMILGAATSWDDMKGYSDFVKLSEIIPENYRIVMVGLTKKQLSTLPKRIIGIERTSSVHELACIYSAANVFVNFTYCDSYGLVNIEAALCGTPVVSYSTGGCPESVGTQGIVVPKGDVSAALEAIKLLEKNPIDICINPEYHDRKRAIADYLNIYQSIN